MRTRDSGKRAIPRFPRNFNDNGPVGTPVGRTDESIEENGPNLRGASLRKRALDSVVPLENVRPVSRPLPSPPRRRYTFLYEGAARLFDDNASHYPPC